MRLSLSCDVSGEIREYERTSTTLANVYVQRITEQYLDRIQEELAGLGSPAALLVMLSSGGLATVETAALPGAPDRVRPGCRGAWRRRTPGGAAGALTSCRSIWAGRRPRPASSKGAALVADELEVDQVYRFKRGAGCPSGRRRST